MSTVISMRRVIFNLLLAAACTPVIIILWQTIKTVSHLDYGYRDVLRNTVGGFVVYGAVAEIAALLFGIPAFLLYRKMRVNSWLFYGVGGAFISGITSALLATEGTLYFFTGQSEKARAWADSLPLLLLCGAVSALAFRAMLRLGHD